LTTRDSQGLARGHSDEQSVIRQTGYHQSRFHPGMGHTFLHQDEARTFWFYFHTTADLATRSFHMDIVEATMDRFSGATPRFGPEELREIENNIRAHLLKVGVYEGGFGPNDYPGVEFKWLDPMTAAFDRRKFDGVSGSGPPVCAGTPVPGDPAVILH
jgi:hypothetical protein